MALEAWFLERPVVLKFLTLWTGHRAAAALCLDLSGGGGGGLGGGQLGIRRVDTGGAL